MANIIVNDKLNEYSQSLISVTNEYFEEQINTKDKMHICDITLNLTNLELKWKLPINILKEIDYINNLGLLITDSDILNAPITYILPMIECIRYHFKKDNVIFKYIDEESTSIYM